MLGLMLLLQTLTVAVAGPPGSPEYLPLRVADAEGYFTREGLSVTLQTTRAESGAAEALAQGQADLAATSLEAILRFGRRPTTLPPRLVFGLTAAPPVRLLTVGTSDIDSVQDLAGGTIALTSPGAPEQTWLQALLARARVPPIKVDLIAVGGRGVVTALENGTARAALVSEPAATALVEEKRARVLVDLRAPDAVAAALGGPTVNAGVFMRSDRRVSDHDLAAFRRALLDAEHTIAITAPSGVAERLPPAVVGAAGEFERRLEATRSIYLPDGLVSVDAIRRTMEMIRAHMPLPQILKVPRPEELLHLESPGRPSHK
jgi:sulfonate transport system substrate-binding protein